MMSLGAAVQEGNNMPGKNFVNAVGYRIYWR
jgi:hypothetical protein